MKFTALALLVCFCGATAASAVESKPAAPSTALRAGSAAAAPQDVVSAAKDAKAKRKKSTTKVLTNADVKKSKGVIGTTTAPTTPVVPEPTLMEKHLADKAARAAAAEKLAAAEIAVADLEAELAAIEQSYYEENDLARRDAVLVQRFNDVKAKLDAAKAVLHKLESTGVESSTPHPPPAPSPLVEGRRISRDPSPREAGRGWPKAG